MDPGQKVIISRVGVSHTGDVIKVLLGVTEFAQPAIQEVLGFSQLCA